jgi:hypothetical protein
MSSLTGTDYINETLSGVEDIYAYNITTDNLLSQPSSYFSGIQSNIQSQLNTINNNVNSITSTNGGGFFCILATQNTGFLTSTPYWGFSSGSNLATNSVPLTFSYTFKVISISFVCQTTPTVAGAVNLIKNGLLHGVREILDSP